MSKGREKGKPFTLSSIENEQLLLINSQWSLKTYPYKQEKKAIVAYHSHRGKCAIRGSKRMCYTQVLGSKAGQKLGGVTLLQEHRVLGVILLLQSVTAFYSYLFIAVYAFHTVCTASLVAIGIEHSRLSLSFVQDFPEIRIDEIFSQRASQQQSLSIIYKFHF